MATIKRFEDMDIWREVRRFSCERFGMTNEGPFATYLKFPGQIQTAVDSIVDDAAESFGRPVFVSFRGYARGSDGEVRWLLHHAFGQNYINDNSHQLKVDEYEKLVENVAGFNSYLNHSETKGKSLKAAANL